MKKLPFLLTLGLSAVSASAAQQVAADHSPRQTDSEVEDIGAVNESAAGEAKDGKTIPKPEPSRWRFNFGGRADYTSNAKLSGNHSSGDFIFFPNLEAGYRAPLGHGFAFDALGRIESGIYADHDERTFIGYSITNTLEWRPKPTAPRIYLGVEPYRYDGFDGQGRITEAIATSVGTDWGYGFNNGNSLLFIGYAFADHFADPWRDSRLAHTGTLGFTQVLNPKLTLQAYYQYVHESYPQFHGRQDSRHIVGFNFTYQLQQHLFTTLSGTFVDSDSSQINAAYQSAGASLGLNYQF